ncbi:DNA cytosine methyltransferase [Flagellimonas sp. CMM7]|uniref:DNA cytosine methyltransferase n=1 Tax=Flagellimonas sp. CMM7 TaxID=2654676 RepID=UPI0013D21A83|nr:DNA (cytosine-5-)-methyltransferase [Flagellimonas sp. CMM7]UII80044.1 DNA (cytosine-5-)-methyltransferase [Flagellimonas sp. CMM7]
MTQGSVFSGFGGFDLAAEWMGWENIFHCEWNEFGQRVLKYYWPNAKSYGDIKTTDFRVYRGKIDVLTGGFPCQPFSTAGTREGTNDNRYLWPEYLRAIREAQPPIVIGENVTGILSMEQHEMFARVDSRRIVRFENYDEYEAVYTRQATLLVNDICEDLEKEGYAVQTFVVPAAGVGAPHRRDRVWFVANAIDGRDSGFSGEHEGKSGEARLPERHKIQRIEEPVDVRPEMDGDIAYTCGKRCHHGRDNRKERCFQGNQGSTKKSESKRKGRKCRTRETCETSTNSNKKGLQRCKDKGIFEGCRKNGNQQFARCIQSNWKEFPTQPPICGRDDGLPAELDGITFSKWRNESIKGYGNAIVPQVAYQFFEAIEHLKNIQ